MSAGILFAVLAAVLSVLAASIAVHWRRRETRARAVLDNVGEGVVTFNAQGVIRSANPAAAGIFGYATDAFIDQPISRLLSYGPADSLSGRQLSFPTRIGTPRTIELEGKRADGTIFPLEMTLSEMPAGAGRRFVAVLRDVTEQKRSRQRKTEFVSTVSHELRTPLTSIRSALNLLVDGAAGPLSPQGRELLGIAHRSSERLVRLIGDLLDIEKVESGTLNVRLEPLDLMPLIQHALESNRAYGEVFSVRFAVGEGVSEAWVLADRDRLEQVLTNLLSNAAKHSPPGETVRVDIVPHAGAVRVTVTDRGLGVPEQFRPALFQRFSQVESANARHKGVGLGLSISKAIIEKHGGQIGFEPRAIGAAFFFELPECRLPASDRQSAG